MRKLTKIVLHHSITPRDLELDKSINSFNNTHRSRLHTEANSLGYHIAYHYIIGGDGEVKQTRGHDEVGYHASNWEVNNESIGICMTGNFDEEKPSEKQLKSLAKLIRELQDELGGLTIHFHNEFSSKSCPGVHVLAEDIETYLKEADLEEGTIDTIYKRGTIDISKGVVKFKLMNYNDDMHKFKTVIMLQNAFGYIAKVMHPIQYIPTKYDDQADIKIYFAHPGDEILPRPFKKGSLGYGIAPYGEHGGKIFINDSLNWGNGLKEGFYWLIKMVVHEGWHTHNIGHSSIKGDIMYPLYEQGDDNIRHSPETIKFIRDLYNLN